LERDASFLLAFQKTGRRGKNSLRILGIDDNEDINEMLKDILTPAGHEFEFVNNGREGLKLIQEQKWDAVLLDIAMPEFSGRAVVNELAKNDNIKKQPIILFTASSISNEEMDEMIKIGVHLCLRKPIEIANLLEILENIKK